MRASSTATGGENKGYSHLRPWRTPHPPRPASVERRGDDPQVQGSVSLKRFERALYRERNVAACHIGQVRRLRHIATCDDKLAKYRRMMWDQAPPSH